MEELTLETEFLVQASEIKDRLKEAEEPLITILKDAANLIKEYSYYSELENKIKQFEFSVKELHTNYLLKREKLVDIDKSKTVLKNSIYTTANIRGNFIKNDYKDKRLGFISEPSKEEKQLPLPLKVAEIETKPKSKLTEEDKELLQILPKELLDFMSQLKITKQLYKIISENDNIRVASSKGTGNYKDLKVVSLA